MIGKTISHYRILEKLGEGGMGVVYKAEDSKLKRTVALKFLPPQALGAEEEKTRFIHEAQAAAALSHPNICIVYEIDEAEGQTFIAMEYIEGQSLKEKIESGPLKLDQALDIAIQVGEGLQEAHEKGIVHRDIKSANVMVTEKGQAKITDFGLAKLAERTKLTKTGMTMGTIAYISPEQAQGTEVDYRTDIWSFGVMLYEMIAGQLPFKGEYEQAVVYSIMSEEPEPITGLRTGVPMELERIVNKALAKKQDERYQNVGDMLIDLKRLGRELEIPGKIQPSKVMVEKSRKEWFTRIAMPGGIILLLLALGFLWLKPLLFERMQLSEPTPIAVISFENQTGDKAYDYLQRAIPNLLITNLEQSKYLSVTTWQRMFDLLKQMGKEDVEIIDEDLGFELCRMDGIDAIVLGSFTKVGNMFATDVKVLDVATKRILKSANAKGKGDGSILETQIDELSRKISRGVGISERKIEASRLRVVDVTTTSMEAYNYFLRGRDYYEKIYPNDARQFLEKAVELDSTFAVAYLYLAWTYYELGNTNARIQAYEKAKTYAQKATEKDRLYIEAAYANAIERNPLKRFRVLKQMATKYPKEKRAHYLLGSYYIDRKMFDNAIQELNKALALDPNYGDAINDLAYTYADMGNFEKAIEYFERYAYVSPGDANPFDSMAETYFRMGKLDDAIAKYKQALEVRPDFGADWRIGYIYALKENYLKAMKWIDQFIAVAPSPGRRAEGFLWKGFYHYWLGNLDSSVSELGKAADLAESVGNQFLKASAHWMKGWIYYDKGKFELSQKYYKSWFDFGMKNYPQYSAYYTANYNFYLGLIDLKQTRIKSVKSRLTEMKSLLAKINPAFSYKDLISFYYDLLYGELLLAENSIEKALVICKEASSLEIPPPLMYTRRILPYNIPFLKDVLARAYLQKGELDKAITEYEQLINFDPTTSKERRLIHPRYHYRLAKLYEQKGWQGKAIEQYEKFLQIWKDADQHLSEMIDARSRLANLLSKR